MIGKLFNAPVGNGEGSIGTSCVGSSEAIILGVLAMKRRWKNKRKAEGKSTENPNIVMNSAVQVCWEKVILLYPFYHTLWKYRRVFAGWLTLQ